jgi:CMP-N-acetylneuraminic acid synthetase
MKNEILGLIPARGGSKGISKKNLKPLLGKPLIQYTIEAAKASKLIQRIILSSEDPEIINYCKGQGIEVPFCRPEDLARDDTPMLDVVKHALEFLRKQENYKPKYVVLLQPTSPLRNSHHIDEALQSLIDSEADSIVSVMELPHNFNPYSVMYFDGKYLKRFLSSPETSDLRQRKPLFYARNGPAVLAFTYNCVMEKDSLYGDKILPYFMNKEESIDIDEEFDLNIAEFIMRRKLK